MAAAGFVVVQADHAMANGTFRIKRMKPPPAEQLYKFDEPYEEAHGRFPLVRTGPGSNKANDNSMPILWRSGRKSWKQVSHRMKFA